MELIVNAIQVLKETQALEEAQETPQRPGSPEDLSEDELEAPPGWGRGPSEKDLLEALQGIQAILDEHRHIEPPEEMVVAIRRYLTGYMPLRQTMAIVNDSSYAIICQGLEAEAKK
ncbi:ATP-dependent Clp protease ATP-binding protein [Anopheles sinensis]|uniref:ATP-dependent Clp protease ATP-binding protein n=1 Tax=Anopheles sinensis TaxID=74873 RepID=A0A084VNT7_ANOSI|nr:ATP-dependent Clp protease ATP-binding protein [Anopheles sinensis]